MTRRTKGYLRSLEDGTLEKYHDYQDVSNGRMPVENYIKKWGPYRGCRSGLKHVR